MCKRAGASFLQPRHRKLTIRPNVESPGAHSKEDDVARHVCVGVGVVGEAAYRMADGAGALFCERSSSGWEGSWRETPLRFAFDEDMQVPHHFSFALCMQRGYACVTIFLALIWQSPAATASRSRLAFHVPASPPPPLIRGSYSMSLPVTFTFRLHVAFGEVCQPSSALVRM